LFSVVIDGPDVAVGRGVGKPVPAQLGTMVGAHR